LNSHVIGNLSTGEIAHENARRSSLVLFGRPRSRRRGDFLAARSRGLVPGTGWFHQALCPGNCHQVPRQPRAILRRRRPPRTTSIAFDLKPNALPADRLPEAKAAFESFFDRRIPRVEWKQKKLIELQGQQWIYLEMTSRAVDTDIHNIMLVTPRYGKMLMFNFNSTREEFPHMETALRKSIQSISLRNRP
jgi:hypothetical protein